METAVTVPGKATAAPHRRGNEHRFYVLMAGASLTIVLAGFGPTYYLRGSTAARPLSAIVHVHGAVFTAWMLLYLCQTVLVATRRVHVHRQLGVAGGVLAVVMLVVGYVTAIAAARRGYNPGAWRDSMAFLAVPIVDLVVFAPLVGAGLYWRRQSATHKRLMLLATISLLGAPLTRLPFAVGQPAASLGPYCAIALLCPLYDWVSHHRVHPAFLWGAVWIVVTVPIRAALGFSEGWHRIAVWLTS